MVRRWGDGAQQTLLIGLVYLSQRGYEDSPAADLASHGQVVGRDLDAGSPEEFGGAYPYQCFCILTLHALCILTSCPAYCSDPAMKVHSLSDS